MEDKQIVDLYWARSEQAISATAEKYGKYCHAIAFNILHSDGDSEECVNDTYLKAWESIPPMRPERLSTFLGKITRNLSLDRYRRDNAGKRGKGEVPLALEELYECLPSGSGDDTVAEDILLTDIFNRFLSELTPEARKFFVRRYWYLSSVKEIARSYGVGESKVKMSLQRSRIALKELLKQEGIPL